MKTVKKILLILFFCIWSLNSFCQYIQVDETYTAQQLVEDVLINSPCGNVSNFSVSGGNFDTGQKSYGFFNAQGTTFAFENGIVLSTGKAVNTIGPNTTLSNDGRNIGWNGDNDLENIIGLADSYNATVLEFDFVPFSNNVSFDYIFSSEQYLRNPRPDQCDYTDGFAFLLREVGTTTYSNLALIPNTIIPVKISTVRGFGDCPSANENYFDAFNGNEHPTNFNGQTKVMKAQATVTPGLTYHIKIVIADEGNEQYDSAIFLGGNSFNFGVSLGDDRSIANNNPLCEGETLVLDATQTSATAYKWFKNGIQLMDMTSGLPITSSTYTATSAGNYGVEVSINSCTQPDEISLEFTTNPIVFDTTLIQCDDNNDGITTFDLTQVTSSLTNNDDTLIIVNYYKNLLDAQNQIDQIETPNAYINNNSNTIYVAIRNSFGCISYATITLSINNATLIPITKEFCDEFGIQDGITQISTQSFDLISSEILSSFPPNYTLNYYTNTQDAILQTNAILTPFTNTIANQQIIFGLVKNGSDCSGIIPIVLQINTFSPTNFQDETIGICSGIPTIIGVSAGFSSYEWDNTTIQNTNQISVSKAGTYSVEVTNNKGCKATKTFTVETSEKATIISININDFNGQNNTVLVDYNGIGDYEFSIDGSNFQDSNYFTNVNQGEYTLTIKDKKGCETVTSDLIVVSYPTFFTPNGDGFNDTWKIKNMQIYPNSRLEIYDRFGKLLKNLSANDTGWNGNYNSQKLIADDYWFILKLNDKREIRGHFSLKR